jgi:HEAT repeat protein
VVKPDPSIRENRPAAARHGCKEATMNKQTTDYERQSRQQTEYARHDARTSAELLRVALGEDEEAAAEAVSLLHYRATPDVLEAVRPLCHSKNSRERSVAAWVLGQLGVHERAFPDECHALLDSMLRQERDPEVLHDLGVACGHLLHPDAVPLLVPLADHPNPLARSGAVSGLLTREDDASVAALIRLSGDEDADVRDWATFGLGKQIDLDTPAIRDALVARLDDLDGVTRGEAIVGLAIRRDERVVAAILAALAMDESAFGERYDLVLEAADELADARLLPALLARRGRTTDELSLESAIERCSGLTS